MKTYVYVDAFNLYYGCLKRTAYRWLDLEALCRVMLPRDQIEQIRYFTAMVSVRDGDQGPRQRQQTYLRALQTLSTVSVHYGQYGSHPVRLPLATRPTSGSRFVEVIKTEEKGSDVNIAAYMLADGFRGKYEHTALISNDSDLAIAVEMVTRDLGLPVTLLAPVANRGRRVGKELQALATNVKSIRKGAVRRSQFSPKLTDASGAIHKPGKW